MAEFTDVDTELFGLSYEEIWNVRAAFALLQKRDGLKVEDMLMAVGKMKDGTSFLFDPSWSRLEEKLKVPGPGWERFPKRMR